MKLTFDYIQRLAKKHEGVDIEFKESTGQLDRGMETLCGMLNGEGGIVVFGVKNSGKIIGQEVGDKTTRMIGEALRRFEPAVSFQPGYLDVPNAEKKLIYFNVAGGNPNAPFAYDGRPYQRLDSVTSVMPMEKFMRIHEKNVGLKYWWGSEVNPKLKLSMIDEGLLLKMIASAVNQNRLTGLALRDDMKTALRRLNLMTDEGLCNAAAVLFGKNIRNEYPQCSLRMARFKGVKRIDFLDNQLAEGNIFELMDAAMTFFFKHLSLTGTTHHRIYRKEELEIPANALREGCLNAFAHRAWQYSTHQVNIGIYDDRVEIENIGRFPVGVNPNELVRSEEEDKKNTSMPQNETISHVLYLTGAIEQWGRGLALIFDECERTGIERPRYVNDDHFVRLVFKRPDMSKWTRDGFVTDPETINDATEELKKPTGNTALSVEQDIADLKPTIVRFLKLLGDRWLTSSQIQGLLNLKSKSSVIRTYIRPSLEKGLITLEQPDTPNSPTQRYGLSVRGQGVYYLHINKLLK